MTDILTIEARRKAHRIAKKALCETAGIDRSTYTRLEGRPNSGRADTFAKLGRALDALAEARALAKAEGRREEAAHG